MITPEDQEELVEGVVLAEMYKRDRVMIKKIIEKILRCVLRVFTELGAIEIMTILILVLILVLTSLTLGPVVTNLLILILIVFYIVFVSRVIKK